mmetsp:Transcript_16934/g.50757  ORF Transcript_16934/g.50757 Transcript_16934/m.50757 type:complete len:354 (-) Transcript_16934:332-1393(-)
MRDSESTSSATRFVHANTSWYTFWHRRAKFPYTSVMPHSMNMLQNVATDSSLLIVDRYTKPPIACSALRMVTLTFVAMHFVIAWQSVCSRLVSDATSVVSKKAVSRITRFVNSRSLSRMVRRLLRMLKHQPRAAEVTANTATTPTRILMCSDSVAVPCSCTTPAAKIDFVKKCGMANSDRAATTMKLPAPISRYLSGERSDQILRSSAPMRGFVSPSLSDWGLLTTHQSCQRCAHEPAGAPREALALADAATHSLSRRTALGAAAAPCRGGFQRRCRCPWSSRGRRKLGADTRWAMPSRADDGQRTPAMRPAPLMARAPQRALRCAVVVAARSWRRRTRVYLLRGNADVLVGG